MTTRTWVLMALAVVTAAAGLLQANGRRPRFLIAAAILALGVLTSVLLRGKVTRPVQALVEQSVMWGGLAVGMGLEDGDWIWLGFAVNCVWCVWDAVRMAGETTPEPAKGGDARP
ncbi:hypothetical protein [Paludibaculum fermentans]|uniref:Uncharacterized protein n=1 Tax=Paludibaculum fermentans TaxID=1473598 RepID=A0A7S7NXB0_PALFE|nr:hypothetical protein [Paludibaculum fermentans]QOY91467.1 hypothetical protein IRI77_16410 [Paludibaculum fermentans]